MRFVLWPLQLIFKAPPSARAAVTAAVHESSGAQFHEVCSIRCTAGSRSKVEFDFDGIAHTQLPAGAFDNDRVDAKHHAVVRGPHCCQLIRHEG